jgi:hypothetical protein
MKRVLLLTYHVPPRTGIASVRIGQMIEGLRAHDWDVVPVTPDLGDVTYESPVVTTGVLDFKAPVRRLLGVPRGETTSQHVGVARGSVHRSKTLRARAVGIGYEVVEYANRRFGWAAAGAHAAARLLHGGGFDAVISSSPPEGTHVVASRVHGTIPWIADLRDPWFGGGMGARRGALRAIDRLLEPRTLAGAAALTTVSEPLARELESRYPSIPAYSIPNAYADGDWRDVPFERAPCTRLLYAGQLYSGRRDPRPLFEAVVELLRAGLISQDEISIDFYGDDSEWLTDEIRRHGVASVVHVHGAEARSDILRLERAASRLLLFLWNDPSESGTYTGKFFEYLGARRKILAIGGPEHSVVDAIFQETGCGERARSVKAIRDAVLHAVVQRRRGEDEIVSLDAVAPYESANLGRRFAEVLDRAVFAKGALVR